MAAGNRAGRGVTYDEVARVAVQILQEGHRPSVRKVRAELGTGSNATILSHLNEWNARRDQMESDATPLPAGVLTAIREALAEAISATRAALEDRLNEAQAQIAEDQQLLADAQAQVEGLEAALAAAEKKAVADQQRLEDLQERLEQSEGRMAQERQARDQAQMELAQARERIKMMAGIERQLAEERAARLDAEKRASAAQARLEALGQPGTASGP